ncbi:ABC transporter permease [Okibacterium endophyticum]
MRLLSLIGRRLASLAITLLISSFAIYAAIDLAPGDSAQLLAGRNASPETIALIREQYHLDQPLFVQYLHWLTSALQGDLGRSTTFRTEVAGLIAERSLTTTLLVVYASVLIVVIGLAVGVLSATLGRRAGSLITGVATVAMGTPAFAVAIFLIWIFSSQLDWFPIYGTGTDLADRLWHLTLPAISLALMFIAYIARITRTAVAAELQSEHVDVARSRGLSKGLVLRRHVLRNASPPVVTLVGLTVAGLVAGTAVAEQAFGLSGLGSLMVTAAANQDIAVVLAVSMIIVSAFVIINMIVDVAVAGLDPRTRAKASA